MFKAVPLLFLTFTLSLSPLFAASLSLDQQRSLFSEAEKALDAGRTADYRQLKAQLTDYPLYPYLLYGELKKKLWKMDSSSVADFLDYYGDTPMADWVRRDWLKLQARQSDWQEYLEFYDPESENTELQCLHLQALGAIGRTDEMLSGVEPLWLSGNSQPSSCDPVFDTWRKAGRLTTALVWQRIALAMEEKGGDRLAKYLGRYLPTKVDKLALELWQNVANKPTLIENPANFLAAHPVRQQILAHGMLRLIKTEGPDHALGVWKRIKGRYPFRSDEIERVEQRLALNLMWKDHSQALVFLNGMDPAHRDEKLLDTGVREAVGRHEWKSIVTLVEQTNANELSEYHRYWYGRALEEEGRHEQAGQVFRKLAKERTYHGFIAADRVGVPYMLDHTPLQVDGHLLGEVENRPAVQRTRELFALKRMLQARREWYKLVRSLGTDELKAFSKLAYGWGWHSRAIFTLARTDYWDDLELRFPLEHKHHIDPIAENRDLDPSWVFAVVRQESAFIPDARSHSGALGLMQLMPATAADVARKLKLKKPSKRDLLQPDFNINLGTSYLRQMLDRLDQNPVLATAAYNAGPHRVLKWLPDKAIPADEWVATIPFDETRGYVERILSYTVIYDARRGFQPRRLSDSMMRPIGKEPGEAVTAVINAGGGAG